MENRFDRQVPFLTPKGQDNLLRSRVAVIGLGGLGCHVVQQLAYLGVTNLTLIDNDKVEASNLNRLVTAKLSDVGDFKAVVMERLVKSVDPNARVETIINNVCSGNALEAIKHVDYIIGCLDHDAPRFFLTKLAAAYKKPYMDLATELGEDDKSYGGRICYMRPGEWCLSCGELLKYSEVASAYQTSGDKQFQASVYGQPLDLLNGSGPSVIALNGIIASVGVMELMLEIAGIRCANKMIQYIGTLGVVGKVEVKKQNDCRICVCLLGNPKEAGLEDLFTR